jgi:hypothetical protein
MAGCIFCGSSPTTKTHIFRKTWIDKVMPAPEPFLHEHERTGKGAFRTEWSKSEFDLAPHAACQSCNGGWMHDVDIAAEALIEGCVVGFSRTFRTVKEHQTLGRWMTLVGILFDQTLASPVITREQHQQFWETREPLPGAITWLAATPPPPIGFRLNGWPRPVRMDSPSYGGDGYFCTIRIEHFVAQTFIPADRALAGLTLTFDRPDIDRFVRQVWPSPLTPVSWPPPQLLAPEELVPFADAFLQKPE